jgi:hypothetical protein
LRTGSRKPAGPAIDASEVGQLDAVSLGHEQDDDNVVTLPLRPVCR